MASNGHPAWIEEDIHKYLEARQGNDDGAMVALMYYTGQRIGDCCKMRNEDMSDQGIRVIQQKTGRALVIPVNPALLAFLPSGTPESYLANGRMERPVYNTVHRKIKVWCRRIGIDPKPPHGLRKSAAISFALAGCTTHEIASITGHTTLKEVQRYTMEVDQIRLARRAMEKLNDLRSSG